jgi:hypothetical protein
MDAQDFRSLQEAYMEVVENQQLDEARREENEEDWRKDEIRNYRKHKLTGTTTPFTDRTISHFKNRGVKKVKGTKVQEDIYDIILSHLLDEGYADTQEAAEAIMVNMSEDWREDIVEGRNTSLSALSRESQKRKEDKERGRPETEDETHRRLRLGRYSPSQYKYEKDENGKWRNLGRKDGEKD